MSVYDLKLSFFMWAIATNLVSSVQIFSEKNTVTANQTFYSMFLFCIYVLAYVCQSLCFCCICIPLIDILLCVYVCLCFSVIGYLALDCGL
jgi:hypothetical protein